MTYPLEVSVRPGPVPWVPCDMHPEGSRPPSMFTVMSRRVETVNVCPDHLQAAVIAGLSAR